MELICMLFVAWAYQIMNLSHLDIICFNCKVCLMEICMMLIWQFLEEKGVTICQKSNLGEWIPVKFLMLILSIVHELEIMQKSVGECTKLEKNNSKAKNKGCVIAEKFSNVLLVILVTYFLLFSWN